MNRLPGALNAFLSRERFHRALHRSTALLDVVRRDVPRRQHCLPRRLGGPPAPPHSKTGASR
jgi:hypothetical protein